MTTIEHSARHARPGSSAGVHVLGVTSTADAIAAIRDRVEAMAHLGVWRLDLATGKAAWSDELYRIFGRAPGGPLPHGPDALEAAVDPADRAVVTDAMAAALRGDGTTIECRLLRSDGSVAPIRLGAERVVDASGRVVALLGYVQPVAAPASVAAPSGSVAAPVAPKPPVAAPQAVTPPVAAPQAAGEEADAATPGTAARTFQLGKGVVLLVEDEDSVRSVLGRMLAILGYSVFEASSGEEALELIGYDDDGIDLVVTDIRMPGMQGTELVSRIRAVLPDVPVLYVTGNAADVGDDHIAGQRTRLLEKPFDAEGLTAAIRALIGADG